MVRRIEREEYMYKLSGNNIVVEGGRIGFRNFSGVKGQYNERGDKHFVLFIDDPKFAEKLLELGWIVKFLKPKDNDEAPQAYIQIKARFDNYPPLIVLVSDGKQQRLTEETVNMLDWAEIDFVDMIIKPYNYHVRGASGIAAYVKTLYANVVVYDIEKKYEMDETVFNIPIEENMFNNATFGIDE